MSKILNMCRFYGLDLAKFFKSVRAVPGFVSNYAKFKRDSRDPKEWPLTLKPLLPDRYDNSGGVTLHYFKQDIYVARKIHERRPKRHIDIGSRLDGFVSHVAVFRAIEVVDIRPQDLKCPSIKTMQGDLCNLDVATIGTSDSVSCLHTIEHIGLGRYGDPVDPSSYLQAINALFKLTEPGGMCYISTPIGRKRVEFDAHRVFDPIELRDLLSSFGKIVELALIDDKDQLHEMADDRMTHDAKGWRYGCAIFSIQKL